MDYDDDDRTVRACPAAVSLVQEEDDSSTQTCQWRAEPLSAVETNKVMQILQACRDHDLEALSALATSKHGLIEDEIRRTACKPPRRCIFHLSLYDRKKTWCRYIGVPSAPTSL